MSLAETSCCEYVGHAIQEQRTNLSSRWLERLVALLPVDANAVFTSTDLLDHVPLLLEEIGKYVAAPEAPDIAANTVVTQHARQMGQLRHRQRASVHQVLREYDLLSEVLDEFLDECTTTLASSPDAAGCLKASRRIGRGVRVLMQITVATFINEYTDMITDQAARLDQFNRAVSHELRNVLGTVQFSAALLTNGSAPTPPDSQRVLTTLRRNTGRALQILRSLEKLPRTGLLPADSPSEQLIDLDELVDEVFRQLRDMAEARDVTLRAAKDLPRLYIDTGKLELVLVNLVANAIKYSDRKKGDRFVEIAVATRDDVHDIRVRDNGIGIPTEAVGKVFERFHRAHQHLDGALGTDGTGLGLAIVDECVKSMRADIRVESEEGVGTEFVLTVPAKGSAEPTGDVD